MVHIHLKLTGDAGTSCSIKSFWRGSDAGVSRVPEERFDLSIRHGTAESISQWSGHAVVPFIAKYRFPICHSLHTGQWTNCLMIVGDHNLLIFVISVLRQGSHFTRQMDHWSNIGLFRWQLCYWVCLSHWHLGNSVLNGSRWSPPPSTKHTEAKRQTEVNNEQYWDTMPICIHVWPFFPLNPGPSFLGRTSPSKVYIPGTQSHNLLCVSSESRLDMAPHHIIYLFFNVFS